MSIIKMQDQQQQQQQTSSDIGSNVASSLTDISKLDVNQLLKDTFQPKVPNTTCAHEVK